MSLEVAHGSGETDENSSQVLTFMMEGQEYGVDILRVQEIKGWDTVTRIPNTPDYVRGVINLRGTIVPIVDLRMRFGMPEVEYDSTTVVIVLHLEGADHDRTMGIVVDAVSDVYNLVAESIKPAPAFGTTVDTDFVKGLATVDEKMMILLDIDRLLGGVDVGPGVADAEASGQVEETVEV